MRHEDTNSTESGAGCIHQSAPGVSSGGIVAFLPHIFPLSLIYVYSRSNTKTLSLNKGFPLWRKIIVLTFNIINLYNVIERS